VMVRGRQEWMGGRASMGAALVFLGIIVSELRLGERKKRPHGAEKTAALLEDEDIHLAEHEG
jgi:hypothetical protein